jgi:ribosome biogenesis GTPase
MSIKLEELGYDSFFESGRQALGLEDYAVARVIAEHRGAYKVKNGAGEYLAEITGKQMFAARSREDYPAVGDWVAITVLEPERAVIHRVLPRKTLLKRRYGGRSEVQLIAANIDTAFIIESVDRDYNLNRFERYLAIVSDGNIEPVLVLNKIDLVSDEELDSMLSQISKRFKDIDALQTSAIRSDGLGDLAAHILKGKTHCLLGSSGVGKSSIINRLFEKDVIKTGAISQHTSKGKHTTTAREMYFLDNGGILIDNPGMREIGMADSDAGIEDVFDDITALSGNCRFRDCTHMHEPGCVIRKAIDRGELDEERFKNYVRLRKEAEYYEMTELEKREKDRRFGRSIKNWKKQQKRDGF